MRTTQYFWDTSIEAIKTMRIISICSCLLRGMQLFTQCVGSSHQHVFPFLLEDYRLRRRFLAWVRIFFSNKAYGIVSSVWFTRPSVGCVGEFVCWIEKVGLGGMILYVSIHMSRRMQIWILSVVANRWYSLCTRMFARTVFARVCLALRTHSIFDPRNFQRWMRRLELRRSKWGETEDAEAKGAVEEEEGEEEAEKVEGGLSWAGAGWLRGRCTGCGSMLKLKYRTIRSHGILITFRALCTTGGFWIGLSSRRFKEMMFDHPPSSYRLWRRWWRWWRASSSSSSLPPSLY